ncbi:hypothetical protein [Paludibaculum fermentans]|uniref:hypothetical protein n=1 Tax=Paludibaculum fermentans TaxID=1473598 RepID=UPI003EB82C7E
MKELTGILDSAVYKLLVTRLIPGATAISTYVWLLASHLTPSPAVCRDFRLEIDLVILFVASAAGLLIDDVGMILENRYFKGLKAELSESTPPRDPTAEWYLYLRTGFVIEPVGHGFLKHILVMLKFEINMAIALMVMSVGVFWIAMPSAAKIATLVMAWGAAVFLGGSAAKKSVDHLATLRFELLKGVRQSVDTGGA